MNYVNGIITRVLSYKLHLDTIKKFFIYILSFLDLLFYLNQHYFSVDILVKKGDSIYALK